MKELAMEVGMYGKLPTNIPANACTHACYIETDKNSTDYYDSNAAAVFDDAIKVIGAVGAIKHNQ